MFIRVLYVGGWCGACVVLLSEGWLLFGIRA